VSSKSRQAGCAGDDARDVVIEVADFGHGKHGERTGPNQMPPESVRPAGRYDDDAILVRRSVCIAPLHEKAVAPEKRSVPQQLGDAEGSRRQTHLHAGLLRLFATATTSLRKAPLKTLY